MYAKGAVDTPSRIHGHYDGGPEQRAVHYFAAYNIWHIIDPQHTHSNVPPPVREDTDGPYEHLPSRYMIE